MYKLLSTLIFLLFALTSWAQIAVTDFKLDPEDVTALAPSTAVIDQNGDKCALIKIKTTQTGFEFDTGLLKPEKIEYHTAEIWLYVPYGVRQINIAHPQLGNLDEWYRFPMPVEKARTYVMKLTTGQVQTIVRPTLSARYVSFTLTPPTARVEIDGQTLETLNGSASKRLPFGKDYTYRVSAPRYYTKEGTFHLDNSTDTYELPVALDPSFTTVSFTTDAAADIYLDGQLAGRGTVTKELDYGTYMLQCRRESHRDTPAQEFTISADSKGKTIKLPSPTPIYGVLDIFSSPSGAKIEINKQPYAKTAPCLIADQLIGTYSIRIYKEGYSDTTIVAEVRENEETSIKAVLHEGFSMSGGNTFTVNGVSFTMIPVEGGTFRMGATSEQQNPYNDEKPVHSVTLSNYMIGETEVTQELWQAVMGNNPSYFKGANKPVEVVSWYDCQTFVQKLNAATGQHFRLPTEAEWEYAARGGKQSKGYQYSGSNKLGDVAWYDGNSNSATHPVKSKQPNELGIYDMSGNVYEWCQDWKGNYSSSAQTNPKGPNSGSGRVLRGGSWYNDARSCRSADRNRSAPDNRYHDLGVRLALSE